MNFDKRNLEITVVEGSHPIRVQVFQPAPGKKENRVLVAEADYDEQLTSRYPIGGFRLYGIKNGKRCALGVLLIREDLPGSDLVTPAEVDSLLALLNGTVVRRADFARRVSATISAWLDRGMIA